MNVFNRGCIRRQKALFTLRIVAVSLMLLLTACTSRLRNKQLEKVAKDWALVIRASQVIPIYPLSEDLQPGDVLLVSTPIEEQVKLYKKKGFLPLDQHMVRIYPKDFPEYSQDFTEFYNSRYGITDDVTPPEHWQKKNDNSTNNWAAAPIAAFPTYSFSVDTKKGLGLALPIKGVPVALGLMNSGSASGTVTIAESHTYGLDNYRLERLVRQWAKENRGLLASYEPRPAKKWRRRRRDQKDYHFLRVIARVYVTGRVDVVINNDEATGAKAKAGADTPAAAPTLVEGDSAENLAETVKTLGKLPSGVIPGGAIQIGTATSRTVTFKEAFPRPIVIGYVGFDFPIFEDGRLGAAISTLAQLVDVGTLEASAPADASVYRIAALSYTYNELKNKAADGDRKAERLLNDIDQLDRLLPETYPFSLYDQEDLGRPPTKDSEITKGAEVRRVDFQAVLDFVGYARATVDVLEAYLTNSALGTEQLENELESARNALTEVYGALQREPIVKEASDFVGH